MHINRIQAAILKQLSSEKGLTVEKYLKAYSEKYLGKNIGYLDELSEQDADAWIHKTYLESINK